MERRKTKNEDIGKLAGPYFHELRVHKAGVKLVFQDDFYKLSAGGVGEGLQRCSLPRCVRSGNALAQNRTC